MACNASFRKNKIKWNSAMQSIFTALLSGPHWEHLTSSHTTLNLHREIQFLVCCGSRMCCLSVFNFDLEGNNIFTGNSSDVLTGNSKQANTCARLPYPSSANSELLSTENMGWRTGSSWVYVSFIATKISQNIKTTDNPWISLPTILHCNVLMQPDTPNALTYPSDYLIQQV